MLGLTVWALPMMAACARDYDAADWRSCPGSTGLWAPGPELAECIARAGVNATETIQVGLGDSLGTFITGYRDPERRRVLHRHAS
jgi:hypothetical protein